MCCKIEDVGTYCDKNDGEPDKIEMWYLKKNMGKGKTVLKLRK